MTAASDRTASSRGRGVRLKRFGIGAAAVGLVAAVALVPGAAFDQ